MRSRVTVAATLVLGALVAVGSAQTTSAGFVPGNGTTIVGSNRFAEIVDADGTRAVVSGEDDSGDGFIMVYELVDDEWTFQQRIEREVTTFDPLGTINGLTILGDRIAATTADGLYVWDYSVGLGSFQGSFEEESTPHGAVAIDSTQVLAVELGTTSISRYSNTSLPLADLTTSSTLDIDSRLSLSEDNGRTLAVGNPNVGATQLGQVDVFQTLDGGALPTSPSFTYANPIGAGHPYFGSDVSVDTDGSIAVGHRFAGASNSGAAWVYRRTGSTLTQLPIVEPAAARAEGEFGRAVELVDGVLVVGEPAVAAFSTGRISEYQYDDGAGRFVGGQTFTSFSSFNEDWYGIDIGVGDGGHLIIAAPQSTGVGSFYHALVGQTEATNKLLSGNPGTSFTTGYGSSVSIDGEWAAISEPGLPNNTENGRVEIAKQTGTGDWGFVEAITAPGFLTVTGFGYGVALDGNSLVVLSRNGGVSEVTFFERADESSPFGVGTSITTSTILPAGYFVHDVDLDGDTAVIVASAGTPGAQARVRVIDRVSGGNWAVDEDITPPGNSLIPNVAIEGDLIAVGLPFDPDGGTPGLPANWRGAVMTYTNIAGSWGSLPIVVLRNPATNTTNDRQFGSDVELSADGSRLVVGHELEYSSGAYNGAVWVYDENVSTRGLYENPTRLTPSTLGDGERLGKSVAIDGDVVVAGSDGLPDETDRVHVFVPGGGGGGGWTESKLIEQPDFGTSDDGFGDDVALSVSSILVGAPADSNENGFGAGAVYWDTTAAVAIPIDDPVLTVVVDGPGATVTAGASGIPVDGLPARAIEGYGGARSNVASTSLDAVDGADQAGEAEVLVETSVADLGLDDADGVGRELLESILLSDIVIEGGWDAVLAGSAFEGLPLQNVTLAEVIDAGLIDGRSLDTLDVSATPIGSIPIGSIALASIRLDDIPLPGGQDWCDLLATIGGGYDCTTTPAADPAEDSLIDLAIQGTPIGSIPIGSIPIGSIPIGSIPIGSIPIGSIDIAQAPIGSIPIGSIDVGSTPIGSIPIGSIPIGSIPIGSIDIGATPIGSIDIAGSPIGSIPLGDLTVAPGIAASPIGSIPIGSIDLAAAPIGSIPIGSIPIGSIPIGSIPIGSIQIDSTPIGSIPIGSIDLAASPIGSIDLASLPIGSIPIGSIAVDSLPIGSIPMGSIPIGSIPIGSIPIGSIDLASSPIGSIPIRSIPAGDLASVIDCTLIDCTAGFRLADAADAGAILPGATLDVFEGVPTGVRLVDLIGIDGLTEADLDTQLATILAGGTVDTLADLLTTDDLTLADLPSDAAELDTTDIEDLAAILSTVTLLDLLVGLGGDEADLRAALTAAGITELNDLDPDGMVLGDLPDSEAQFQAQTIDGLLAFMTGIRLGDLLALHPTLTEGDVDWGSATLADVSDWDDVTLAELEAYGATTVAELITAFDAATAADVTFGELLLSLVGTKRHEWTEIELGAIELENTSGAQTFTSRFEVTGGFGLDRTVTIRSTIPDDAEYVEGSTVIRAGDSGTLPDGSGEPRIDGNQLVWTLAGVRTDVEYEIDIDVVNALSLGTNTVTTTGSIVGLGIETAGFTSVGVQQAFEPNDEPGDAGIVDAVSGTIYASHVADASDVDLFRIDLPAGARLSVALSDLPADYDLVVYGPQVVALAPPLRQIDPAEPPEITVDPTVNDSGGTLLQDVPLLDLPVVGVSTNRSTESESVVIDAVRQTGTYHVQVSGYGGASSARPYALYIASDAPPTPLACVSQDHQSLPNRGTLPTVGELAGANTFVLVNRERLFGKYGSDATTALDAIDALVEYTNVTNTGLGTTVVVVEIDGDDDVRAAYDALDAASCEPATANAVVGEINELVDALDAVDPATPLEQILIVGDDDIVPMARIADDTNIANERTYASTFLDSSANSLFGALSTGHFLSDDPYGDADPIRSGDRILYVTDIGLGRLVENPAEIAGQVATFIGFGGQLDPSTALVTGYDFLTDGSEAIVDAIEGLPDTDSVTEIISETWTAQDVIDALFPEGADSPNVASINAHYDHYRALPADQNAAGTESDLFTTADVDLAARAGRLAGRALHSMGCHGGLSVPDELFPGVVDGIALDWAQAYARQGAIWVGNTGFGYGETEGVELSERLMALYSGNLDGSVNAGEALLFAKQEYLGTQQATYGPFDEKVLQQTVFYGIPFYEVAVAVEPPAEPVPPRPATSPVPGTDLRLGTVEVTPDFTPSTNDGGVVYRATLPGGAEGDVDEQGAPFSPILPTVSFDVSDVDPSGETPQTVAQGALITGLITTDVPGVDPDLARPIVDDSDVETEPRVGDVSTDPTIFVSSFSTPEGPRQSLTAVLGTFRSTERDGSGIQRLFDELEIETYYRDPADSSDQTRPVFREVSSLTTEINGEQVLVIDVVVSDDLPDNVLRVFALVAVDPGTGTEWTSVELVNVDGDTWSGSLVVGAGDIEFLVQAVDGNGNTALSTNKTEGFDGVSAASIAGGPIEVVYSTPPGGFFTGPVTLTATANGAIVDVQIDGGAITPGSASTEVTIDPAVLGEGTHTVVFTTESGERRTEVLLFDATAPVATIISPVDGATVDGAAPGRVRFSCADAASGIASCTATLGGSPIESGDELADTPGTFELRVTAIDTAGIETVATSEFTVTDAIAPVVTVPTNVLASTDAGEATATRTFTATATDVGADGTSGSLVPVCVPASGSAFSLGETEVTCTATDLAGNVGSDSFTITVVDTEAPTIDVGGTQTFEVSLNAGGVVDFVGPTAADNSGAAPTIECSPASGSTFTVGDTLVTCTATDAAGNDVSDSFTVSVSVSADVTNPVVSVPDDTSVGTDAGEATAVVTFSVSATDVGPTSASPLSVAATCVPVSGSAFSLGTTEVTCTATDAAGNQGSASFDVSVSDDEAPVFGAAPDQSFEVALNAGGVVDFTVPTATDNVDAAPTIDCSPASGSTFSVGTTEVTCDASDVADNESSVSFDVSVSVAADVTKPVVSVPADVSTGTDAGEATAVVTFSVSATDVGPTSASPVSVAATCVPVSGSVFSLGTTEVTCSATDAAGNQGSASFDVTVFDDEAPVFGSAPDQSFEVALNAGGVVDFAEPTASDNVDASVSIVCSPASGSAFSVGTTEVTCTATDTATNQRSVSFDVNVTVAADVSDPVVTVPADISTGTDDGSATALVTFSASATDDGPTGNVSIDPVCSPLSGSAFSVGTTEVTCTATDAAGNQGSASFDVTVADDEAPVFGAAPNQSFEVPTTAGGAIGFTVPTATDNVDATVTVVCDPVSGSTFAVGSTDVTCTATDAASNESQVTFAVQVATEPDTIEPVVSVPADVAAGTDDGVATAVVTFTVTATDGGPAGTVDVDPVCAPQSGSTFSLGTTEVTCTATDSSGNEGSASFDVTVSDDEAPVFGAAPNQSFEVPTTAGDAIDFTSPTATDNVDLAPTVVCDPVPGSTFAVGSTDVTCIATDAAENQSQVTFAVQVATEPDTVDPVVTVPSDVAIGTDDGAATAIVTFTATSTDDGPAGLVEVVPVCEPAAGSTFSLGTTTVTCTATDGSGNETSESFDVTVSDDEAPVFGAAPDQAFIVSLNSGGVVDYVMPTATDNVDTSPSVVCTPLAGSTFTVGGTTVDCVASDAAGNESSVSFDVTVGVADDTTAPTVEVPDAAVTAATEPGATETTVTFTATASDIGPDGTLSVEPVCVPASGSAFSVGDTTVTCTATDAAGNSTDASFTVSVTGTPAPPDTTPPVVTVSFGSGTGGGTSPGDGSDPSIEVDTEPGESFAIVTFEVNASDPDAASSTLAVGELGGELGAGADADRAVVLGSDAAATLDVTCTPASGSRFPIGTTTVTCTATDAAGNVGSASFAVIVNDVEAPAIAAPVGGSVTVAVAGPGPVDYALPDVLDNSGVVSIICDPPPGSDFPIGTTRVTCTATDDTGNTSTIAFDIVIELQQVDTNLPATGGGGLDLRPAWLVLLLGLTALLVARRRRSRLRVHHS